MSRAYAFVVLGLRPWDWRYSENLASWEFQSISLDLFLVRGVDNIIGSYCWG